MSSSQFATNICVANLTAGFIDLATYDELEKYMYGGPDATAYFVRETRKSTWFTQCPVTLAKCCGAAQFGGEFCPHSTSPLRSKHFQQNESFFHILHINWD